jgi:hypothetical protein
MDQLLSLGGDGRPHICKSGGQLLRACERYFPAKSKLHTVNMCYLMYLIIDAMAEEHNLPPLNLDRKALPGGFFKNIENDGIHLVGEPSMINAIIAKGQNAGKTILEDFYKGLESKAICFKYESVAL